MQEQKLAHTHPPLDGMVHFGEKRALEIANIMALCPACVPELDSVMAELDQREKELERLDQEAEHSQDQAEAAELGMVRDEDGRWVDPGIPASTEDA